MDSIFGKIQFFIQDLRGNGIPVGSSQLEDCYRALSLVSWSYEPVFYSSLLSTLLKESALLPIFDEIYRRHFHPFPANPGKRLGALQEMMPELPANRKGEGDGSEATGESGHSGKPVSQRRSSKAPTREWKDPLSQDFYSLTPQDLKRMESLIPLLAKRLVSKTVMKRRREESGILDHRRTLRQSMATGGIPAELFVKKRVRQKPVIFALCDVSLSCLHFSAFSLALVYSLEKFFRHVRCFAFVGETEEVTAIMRKEQPYNLRAQVLYDTKVTGESGRTDYGRSLVTFYERYGQDLSHKSQVLIFGDARSNWFPTEPQVLKKIQDRVKRVYWFNPETINEWNTGDSSMSSYRKYCDRVFQTSNLDELMKALTEL
ncbi:MAG: VWA domain-containing protein [Bacillota bacterium]